MASTLIFMESSRTALAAVPIVLMLAALVAAWIPARNAVSIDPIQALRMEYAKRLRAAGLQLCPTGLAAHRAGGYVRSGSFTTQRSHALRVPNPLKFGAR